MTCSIATAGGGGLPKLNVIDENTESAHQMALQAAAAAAAAATLHQSPSRHLPTPGGSAGAGGSYVPSRLVSQHPPQQV